MKLISILTILAVLAVSCSVGPEPISYGKDNCAHCEMTIMDNHFGSELVTDKGKVYKFDSVECLVEYMKDHQGGEEAFSLVLITPFDNPGNFEDATGSYFLHSRKLPSPMGMYLTAYADESTAMEYQGNYGGRMYNWKDLNENFRQMRTQGIEE